MNTGTSADRITLDFVPFLPWPMLAALAALGLLAVGWLIWRGKRGAWVRLGALALVFLGLADPRLISEKRDRLSDVVVVAVDRSGSQTIGNRMAETEAALKALSEALKARPNTELRVVDVFDRDGTGDGTRLFEAIASATRDVPQDRLAGVIAITDGVVHDIPADRSRLSFTAPLHALITGRPNEFDRRIELVEAPRFGIVGKEVTATVRIENQGGPVGPVRMTIRQNGEAIGSRNAMPGQPVKVPLKIDRAGMNLFEITIETAPGELTALNNRLALPVEGVREKLRVLLVSGEPHAGERTWRNLLKADPNVELVHFTILRPPEKQDSTPTNELSLIAFPTRELFIMKIAEFDLIIFDRYSNQTFLPTAYFENMVRYVREGGAILFAVGPEIVARGGLLSTPLREIMPAEPTGTVLERAFRAEVTDLGRRHPVTRNLDGAGTPKTADPASGARWSPWFRQIAARPRSGLSLMNGIDNGPLLELKREGKGRVGLFLSDHVWLWARGYAGGGPYLDLLRRLSHWLMKEPELEEEALRLSVSGGRIVIERRTIGGPPGDARLTEPAGESLPVTLSEAEPGVWRAEIAMRRAGLYRAENGGLVAFVNAGQPNPKEFRQVVSTIDDLAPIAEATGGGTRRLLPNGTLAIPRLVDIRSGGRYSGADYLGLRPTEASVLKGVTVMPLGLGFLGLGLLLLPLIGAWLAEGFRRKPKASG
ncbi:MAG: hypothetical protein FD175_695 [Beijerinckiaceae bacterium]|nr:MAG: hypothetical protein FD175_695 [Beijerinckiaceae bacterium]